MNFLEEEQLKQLEMVCTSAEQKMFTTTKIRQKL